VDSKRGWAVGLAGTILHTSNGGNTWSAQKMEIKNQSKSLKPSLAEVRFVNETTGWIVGDFGTILHTTNGGKIWREYKSPTQIELTGISFANQDTGWAIGKWGLVLKYKPERERVTLNK
jgi:photosystem II stability/assembly factor-like uncharacterized protein